jgi:hypothetical protein
MLAPMPIYRALLCTAALSATVLVTTCSRSEPGSAAKTAPAAAPPSWTLTVAEATGPAGANSSLPQLTSSDRGVIASWIEQSGQSTSTLKFAERTASGWSAPMTVSTGNNWFLSYADPPNIMRRSDGTLVANWQVSTNPELEGSDLTITYSTDDGKTWAKPFLPHHDGTKGQHAFPSFFELPGNGLGVVWVDARAQAANPEDLDASYSVRYAQFDSSWKRTGEGEIDAKTCECCSTSSAVTSDGVITAYRDRAEQGKNEIRDIAVSRFENGKFTAGAIVHPDNFETYSCPVNGPMVTARDKQAVVAWFTVKNDQGQAWAAFSNDAGRTWDMPIRLDDGGSLGRVDVELLDDGSAIASWVEFADKRGQFRLRRIEPSGMKSAAINVAGVEGSSSSGFPRVARRGKELVFAWTESAVKADNSTTFQVKTATATLP